MFATPHRNTLPVREYRGLYERYDLESHSSRIKKGLYLSSELRYNPFLRYRDYFAAAFLRGAAFLRAGAGFIFAAIAEELGLVGVFAVLSIYLLITYRGLRIAMSHRDDFSRLLAAGLSFVIALQVFIVVGGVLRLVPLTGLTTPFLAAGGSSLLANWLVIALLIRISDSANKQVVP